MVEAPRPAVPGGFRYEALDSLRGVCACGVVLYHLHTTGVIANLPVIRQGGLFVDFFFVLSGFVIAASYGARLKEGFPLRAYMLLRLGRIYPMHVFMLLAFLALYVGHFLFAGSGAAPGPLAGDRTFASFLGTLFFLQIFEPGSRLPWNAPSWSIAAEMWTYFLTAIGLVVLRDRFRFVLGGIVVIALILFGVSESSWPALPWTLVRCLLGFSIGMLTFELHARLRGRSVRSVIGGATLAELAVLALAAAAMALLPIRAAHPVCSFAFALAIFVLAEERGAVSAFLKRRPMRLIGILSYSIYMVHWMMWTLLLRALAHAGQWFGTPILVEAYMNGRPYQVIGGGALLPDLLTVLYLGLVISVAWMTYQLVERPFRTASRRLAERIAHRPVAAAEQIAPTM